MAAEIKFVCRAEKHQRPAKASTPSSPITYHENSWAYCASGAASDHEWEAVTSASLEEIRLRMSNEDRRRAPEGV